MSPEPPMQLAAPPPSGGVVSKIAELERPRFSESALPIPVSGDRLAILRGTTPAIDIQVDDFGGATRYCLSLLDGERSWDDVVDATTTEYPSVTRDDLTQVVDALVARGIVEDAAAGAGLLTEEEQARYSRNLNFWSLFPAGRASKYELQRELADATVLILGLGGIGTNVALGLSMLGVGHLALADFDTVELQNLNRQVLYDTNAVGKPKPLAAAERIAAVNPAVDVSAIPARIDSSEFIDGLLDEHGASIMVLAADRPAFRVDAWTSESSFRTGIPYIAGNVYGHAGEVWAKVPGRTGCDECDRLWVRDTSPLEYEVICYCDEHDLNPATTALGWGAQAVGAFIGCDVMRHVLGQPMTSAGCMIRIDLLSLSCTREERPPHAECPVCDAARREAAPAVAGR